MYTYMYIYIEAHESTSTQFDLRVGGRAHRGGAQQAASGVCCFMLHIYSYILVTHILIHTYVYKCIYI